jgi:acetate kinase
MKILVLNSGSSSQKSCLYEIHDSLPELPPKPVWEGKIEWDGNQTKLQITTAQGTTHEDRLPPGSRRLMATDELLNYLWSGQAPAVRDPSEIDVVGHRIVNGGIEYESPTFVTPKLKAAIARMAVFAPLHNRAELEGIEIIARIFPSVPQVAVFDTGFHSHLPDAAAVYPGPYDWLAQGIRRYGFHGINHQYCAERTASLLGKDLKSLRLVTCHLGNGCSLAAIRDGHSVDTTMGFTPLEGLMMGTRSGSVDPGILTYLMRQGSLTGEQLDDLLNLKSGLLGISGISGDMRQIVSAMKEGNARAKLAFEIFVHRLKSCIGSMVAILCGMDALVFTAGIGENSSEVRAAACEGFGFLGVKLDSAKNARSPQDQDISLPDSAVRLLIVRAQEDWAIARECWRLMSLTSLSESRGQKAGSA